MKDKLKIIIPLLLAAVIGLCYYKFAVPMKEELEVLQREEAQLRQEYDVNLERIQSIPTLRGKIEETEEGLVELAKRFYDNWAQEEYIMRVREFGNQSKVNMLAVNYLDDSVLEVEYNTPAPVAQNDNVADSGIDNNTDYDDGNTEDTSLAQMQRSLEIASKTVYTIDFQGSYSQLKTLMQLIDWDEDVKGYSDDGKFIVCDQLTIKAEGGSAGGSARAISIADSSTSLDAAAEGNTRAIMAVPASARTASTAVSASRLECTIEIGFYYLEGFESYNLHEDYTNLLKERGLRKTGGTSPFKGVK